LAGYRRIGLRYDDLRTSEPSLSLRFSMWKGLLTLCVFFPVRSG
jgi:hypothetical protein